jgi:hypothetical protein
MILTPKYFRAIAGMFFILTASLSSLAQNKEYKRVWDEFYDEKPLHFGFLFGFSNTYLGYRLSDEYLSTTAQDTIKSVVSPGNFEFHVGLVAKFGLAPQWELRFAPAITITTRQVEYLSISNRPKVDERNSTWFEIPVTFKYLSKRRHNSRMYLLGGAKVAFETGTRKQGAVQGRLDMKTTDLAIEYGVGFEQFLQYTKFTPEIRFTHGLNNLFIAPNIRSSSPYSSVLSGLYTNSVSLYLYFE